MHFIVIIFIIIAAIVVGFDMTDVTVVEGVGDVQLCVAIMEPSDELPFPPNLDFILKASTRLGSARTYVDCYS